MKEIESKISEIDELYYWATSYCLMHHCTVWKFIKNNRDEIEKLIRSHEALKH